MEVSPHLIELLRTFNTEKVRFLVVGAHAVAYHAEPRYTKDFDIWVEASPENAARVWAALKVFRAPLSGLKESDFTNEQIVYQMGIEPHRIDILTGIDGATFAPAWKRRVPTTFGTVPVYVLGRTDLIRCKQAAGRAQDLLDVERLRRGAASIGRRKKARKR